MWYLYIGYNGWLSLKKWGQSVKVQNLPYPFLRGQPLNTPKPDNEHPRPFHMGVPQPGIFYSRIPPLFVHSLFSFFRIGNYCALVLLRLRQAFLATTERNWVQVGAIFNPSPRSRFLDNTVVVREYSGWVNHVSKVAGKLYSSVVAIRATRYSENVLVCFCCLMCGKALSGWAVWISSRLKSLSQRGSG